MTEPNRLTDRERWDARHAAKAGAPVEAPDPFVQDALERLGPGAGRRAVDLAAGGGRHALELARRGWRVSAWDVSPEGLALLGRRAEAAGVQVERRVVDLSGGPQDVPPEPFDLALVVNFLDRALLARLPALLRPGGHAVCATFTVDRPGEKPALERCLARGELARGLAGLDTIHYAEEGGRAGILARRVE